MKSEHGLKKIIVGLTGSFGSGKTIVAKMFKARGADVIDADAIARTAVQPGTAVYRRLKRSFGCCILKDDKTVDRRKLAELVFGDKRRVREMNAIVHPEVIRVIDRAVRLSRNNLVVIDAPLLIEAGLHKRVEKIVVVSARLKNQLIRLGKKTHYCREHITKRIRAQMPLSRKIRIADFVIDNNGTLKQTREQVNKVIEELKLDRMECGG